VARNVFKLLIASAALIAPVPAMAENLDRSGEVRAAVNAFGLAFSKADISNLESSLTNDYVHVNGGSGKVLGRDDWLKWMESRRAEIKKGIMIVEDYRIEDIEIELNGDTAIVVGRVVSSVKRDGVSKTSEIRFSNTWLYREGVWRRASFHDSPMPRSALDEP
jgi:ketosteroid isomerase-like protein